MKAGQEKPCQKSYTVATNEADGPSALYIHAISERDGMDLQSELPN